uniref:Uncharacterized protein n=1 Tax=Oryza glumipatula TaxID=40148 RepID=A0A0E0AT61_9ORYZ
MQQLQHYRWAAARGCQKGKELARRRCVEAGVEGQGLVGGKEAVSVDEDLAAPTHLAVLLSMCMPAYGHEYELSLDRAGPGRSRLAIANQRRERGGGQRPLAASELSPMTPPPPPVSLAPCQQPVEQLVGGSC